MREMVQQRFLIFRPIGCSTGGRDAVLVAAPTMQGVRCP